MDDEEFSTLIAKIAAHAEGNPETLADALLVDVSTVARWGRGENLPHPNMRQTIVDRLMQLAMQP